MRIGVILFFLPLKEISIKKLIMLNPVREKKVKRQTCENIPSNKYHTIQMKGTVNILLGV